MLQSALLLTIIAFILKPERSQTLVCVTPNELKTRIFDSVSRFQGNKIPFNPAMPGWEGSNVEFNVSKMETLQKNIFLTHDSQHILTMKLSGKQIKKIDEGAFIALDCLHELLLDHNNMSKLSRNTFQGLYNLQKLDLSYNRLEYLPDLAFTSLQKLKILNLSRNRIRSVQSLAFENLILLEDLNLEFNQLETVDVDVFRSLRSLKSLMLAWNGLTNIEPEKWSGLETLENLDLAGNGLNHFDPNYNFSFSALKTLNLSGNFLTKLNVEALNKHLPSLGFIDLNDNPWVCTDLESIVHDLNVSKVKFASRNSSTSTVSGIACSEVPIFMSKTNIEDVISSTTKKSEDWSVKNYVEGIVEKKIKESNVGVISSIRYLQSLVIFLFVLIALV
ncbi:leucine-rich repeat-containing protein 15-like [Asbolus verrucosus]|uniref:Leucine-rich repeat-containing protein 15-like n=1 Tax=Asbolus verrucosus TaxID=1661398 RepID=A0A482VI69_ASBVE|nr:leucine-rich repeat-containing protein 15-like [Asbolus verrucosus]